MNPPMLTYNRDGNAMEYRYRGILIARCKIQPSFHPQENMVTVITRIRVLTGTDIGYRTARDIWDNRKVDLTKWRGEILPYSSDWMRKYDSQEVSPNASSE